MISKLRKKFVLIATGSVLIVLLAILGTANIVNYNSINRSLDKKLDFLMRWGGNFDTLPPGEHGSLSPEAPFDMRYFSVLLDKDGEVQKVDTGRIAAVSRSEAIKLAKSVFNHRERDGFCKIYKFDSFKSTDGIMYVFLDAERELDSFYTFLIASIVSSIIGLTAVFFLVLFLSKYALRPISESYEKQKSFITNAGHELKTPITIIDANAEVIEMEYGKSEWTDGIKKQTRRLGELTNKLVMLSRMQEYDTRHESCEFSLSVAVSEAAEPYKAIAEASGKTLNLNIEDEITLVGNEAEIRQLISLLLDNAAKYSNDGGEISLCLKQNGRSREITVTNTVDYVKPGNLNRFFERFYREDSSRNSKTGGFGIGLSVAEAIVKSHKGNIEAFSPDEKTVTFRIML